MKYVMWVAFVLWGCVFMVSGVSAETFFTEGRWEISIAADTVGETSRLIPKNFSCCLTEENPVPVDPFESMDCEYVVEKIDGNTVIWSRFCKDEENKVYETSGEIDFSKETLKGYLHTIINDPREGISDLTEEMSGKFIGGECPKAN